VDEETIAELLERLLGACNAARRSALDLAQGADIDAPLRDFLLESARQCRHAADDVRRAWDGGSMAAADAPLGTGLRRGAGEDPLVAWERTACELLTYFRDAYDLPLPASIAEVVKRHYEAGVGRLERLRELQAAVSDLESR
jgi:hypothetical protein